MSEFKAKLKKIGWKKLFVILLLIKILLSSVSFGIYHFYFRSKGDTNLNEFLEDSIVGQSEQNNISNMQKNIQNPADKNIKPNDDCLIYENKMLDLNSKYQYALLWNDFYRLRNSLLKTNCTEQQINNFAEKFKEFFPNKKIATYLQVLLKNFADLKNKSQILKILYDSLLEEPLAKGEFIKIEKISDIELQKKNINIIIEKINQNEWKIALDLLQKSNLNKKLADQKNQLVKDIQRVFTVENALNSIENIMRTPN